ncbi:hypothetical protein LI064_13385 [Clostridium perfringens]|uniref:hypothetical protein n=1 Tax=Clostridium perfringens TaxID=1502 RepID=UPI002246CD85|nr:hypothetical protein [Clostridium perfringens]MCX0355509.1 hypothetical protein [Clostridium perfringens]
MADFKNNTTNNINSNNIINNSSKITIENSNGNINGNIAIGNNNNNMSFNGVYVNNINIDNEQLINELVKNVSKLETATTDIRPYFNKEFDIDKIKKEVELKGIQEVANDLNVFALYYGVEEERNYTVMEFKEYLNDKFVDEVKKEIEIEKVKAMMNDIDEEQLINALVEGVSKLETATTDIRPYFNKEFDIDKIKNEIELKGIQEVANDLNVFSLYYGVEEERNYTVMEFKDYLNDNIVDEVKKEIAIEKIKAMMNDENDIDEELNSYNNQILDKTILEKIIEHLDKYIEKFKEILEAAKLKVEKTSEMIKDKEKNNELNKANFTNSELVMIGGLENKIDVLKGDIESITLGIGITPEEREEFYNLPKEEQEKINKRLESDKLNMIGELILYDDLNNFLLKNDIARKEYILNKDLNIDGSFIEKGTSFFVEGFKNDKFEVHFEGNENNSYKNDVGNGYYFDEFELSKMVDLTKIKELNGKEIEVFNNQYLYKTSEKKYSDNELHQKYEEWRTQRAEENQDKNNPFIWDCTEESARKDFSEFIGLKETMSCDEMLGLEYKYEIGKVVNLSKDDYNLLGIEHPENALKNVNSSLVNISEEQLNVIKDKSMNDLASEDREVFSHLIKEKSLGIFEKDIYEYYDAIDSIEKKAINEDIYSLIGENSVSKVVAENLEEKINRRIDILVDLGIDKNFNYDIAINKVNLNDNLNAIFADYLSEGVEIRHKDSLDEGQEIKSIKEFEDYAIDYLTPVSLEKNEEEANRKELENEIEKWNYKELLEFAQDNELNIEKVDRSIELEKDKEKKKGMSM